MQDLSPDPEKFTLFQAILGIGALLLATVPAVWKFLRRSQGTPNEEDETNFTKTESRHMAALAQENARLIAQVAEDKLRRDIDDKDRKVREDLEFILSGHREAVFNKIDELVIKQAQTQAIYQSVVDRLDRVEERLDRPPHRR